MRNYEDIYSFLYFGFLTNNPYEKDKILLPELNLASIEHNSTVFNKSENDIIEEGVKALTSSYKNVSGDLHIVPLSGGCDSRAILAGLVNAGLESKIVTVTFGAPGSLDYELGAKLSRKLGLRHKQLDLTRIDLDYSRLVKTAQNGCSWTFLLDGFYNSLITDEYGKDATYWSGYMGGELAGSHLPLKENVSWGLAKQYFVEWNRFVRSINLTPSSYCPENSLPNHPLIDRSMLSYDEQLDFVFRQQNYIKRVVTFEGYTYKKPFLDTDWVRFILGLPRQYRIDNYIYKKVLLRAYPGFFALPTTNTYGGALSVSNTELKLRKALSKIRNRVDKRIALFGMNIDSIWNRLGVLRSSNYVEYNTALRSQKNFKDVIRQLIDELIERKIVDWIDINMIWDQHQKRKANHGEALILLAALELSLKNYDN